MIRATGIDAVTTKRSLATLFTATAMMILVGEFGSHLIALLAAISSVSVWVILMSTLIIRQFLTSTKTGSSGNKPERSIIEAMFTFAGYDSRVVAGLLVHLAAMWWLRPFLHDDPTPVIGVGISGLYVQLLVVSRRPDPGYGRN